MITKEMTKRKNCENGCIRRMDVEYIENGEELPGIRNIRGAMVQDKPKYCNAYANYVQPDWDTTYTILQDFNPAVAQTICTCGQPYRIGGYKWKVDCVPI